MKNQIRQSTRVKLTIALALLGLSVAAASHAGPQITSWLTAYSGKYARIYNTDANKTNGTSVTTWSNGSQTQSSPAYSGVQEIDSSTNWIYIRSTGLGSHIMGPWYLDLQHTQAFPNYPVNTRSFYRFPLTGSNTVPSTKTLTTLGVIGYFVDGVAMFDSRDGFVWTGSAESGNGTGYWNREAYVNESLTFDPGYAHQEQTGTHHYHANPIALRYQLGDHVDFNSTTKMYSESTGPVTKHSPILGWVRDGYPVYGPYGYSSASNSASGIRRMISGFVLRNGQSNTANLAVTGRTAIPQWAVRAYGVAAAQSGPSDFSTYPLSRYMEDNDYLGDLGYQQGKDFDLDEYNGRYCITPEFPGGTYAYFVAIKSDGTPVYPYNIGRTFYGNPTGSAVTSISETVTTNFLGESNMPVQINNPKWTNNVVTLVWSTVEGGTYQVTYSTNLSAWTTNASNLVATNVTSTYSGSSPESKKFFRVARTALAAFDSASSASSATGGSGILSVSPTSGLRGNQISLTINLDSTTQPAPPPQNAPINSITVGTITGGSNTHVSQTQVTTVFTIPANAATGPQTVTVVFPGPPGNAAAVVTYTLPNGFMIQ